jgi:homoserine O-acetyltransferase
MDPEWKKESTLHKKVGLSGAIGQLMFMVSSPLQWQKSAPTREEAEENVKNSLRVLIYYGC